MLTNEKRRCIINQVAWRYTKCCISEVFFYGKEKVIFMEFLKVFTKVGTVLNNHATYSALKAEYIVRGYSERKARYAALGCMSGRSQHSTCRWYKNQHGIVYFERLA